VEEEVGRSLGVVAFDEEMDELESVLFLGAVGIGFDFVVDKVEDENKEKDVVDPTEEVKERGGGKEREGYNTNIEIVF